MDPKSPKLNKPIPPRKLRRKRQSVLESSSSGPSEEWMLTYMDTVTLLVTLFVMILSFANFDKDKFEEFKQGISLSKYGAGILMGSLGIRESTNDVRSSTPKLMLEDSNIDASKKPEANPKNNLLAVLQNQINQQGLIDDIQLRESEGTVEMEINESVLFPLGSAELSKSGISVLTRLSELLNSHDGTIAVEGHTDNLPIKTILFPSNWELSGARASSVARHFISGGVDSHRVRIVGYADTQPLASNATPGDRQRNRRVNIVLEIPSQSTSN